MNIILRWLGVEALISKAVDETVERIYEDLDAVEAKSKQELNQEIIVIRSTLWSVIGSVQDSISDLRSDMSALKSDKGNIEGDTAGITEISTELNKLREEVDDRLRGIERLL